MKSLPIRRLLPFFAAWSLIGGGGTAVAAEIAADAAACPQDFAQVVLEEGVRLCASTIRLLEKGTYEASGDVTIQTARARFQADRITLREERFLEAQGHVLVVWESNRISGDSMTYDLESRLGTIENAQGELDPEFYFTAKRAEKVGEDRVVLESATVTTCTQPVPYWSFSVSTAEVHLDHYAQLWNLRLRTGRVPIFYLPYLVWPVKPTRAAGLLLPNFGTTQNRGRVFSLPLFLPLGKSADVTLYGEYYTIAGWGAGAEFRGIPNPEGAASLGGYYIWDQVTGAGRYNWKYEQTQSFVNGFRMVADWEQVSDFNYFTDFERDINRSSQPQVRGRLEFSRNGSWTSLNVREFRIEQLFSDGSSLVQQTFPEIEWRGRSKRLGSSPLYFSFVSSAANIRQRSENIDAHYGRADFAPSLSIPISPTPWLDITPSVETRVTYYGQQREPIPAPDGSTTVLDESLTRYLWGGTVEVVGPKAFRIFSKPEGRYSPRYKHTVEPRIVYSYNRADDTADEILVFDEIDRLANTSNVLQYGIRSRLFAQRPRAATPPPRGEGERIILPPTAPGAGVELPAGSAAGAAPPEDANAPSEPVEIASLEILQRKSYLGDLSSADLDGDGIIDTRSSASDVQATGRFNPAQWASMDVRATYNHLYGRISGVSVSGNLNWQQAGRLGFSVVRRPGLAGGSRDSTQLRLGGATALWGGRVRLALDGTFVPTATGEEPKIPDQRWVVEFYTQCCGILGEFLKRDFVGNERREFRVTVDLRGIGKLFDFHEGSR
jgi:opacity protein-like surface antigen